MKKGIAAVMLLAALSGCGGDVDRQDTVGLDEEQRAVLATVLDACPGLTTYREDWTLAGVEVKPAPEASSVEFVMAEKPTSIPGSYYAMGHRCYAEVGGEHAGRVALQKRPCVKVCRDVDEEVPTSTLIEITPGDRG